MKIDDFINGIYALSESNGRLSLANPYQLERNDGMTLENGFAVSVGAAVRTDGSFSNSDPNICLDRELGLIFTGQNIGDSTSISTVRDLESELRNEAYAFFSQISKDRSLSSIVLDLNVSSDELTFFGGEDDVNYIGFTLFINTTNKELI